MAEPLTHDEEYLAYRRKVEADQEAAAEKAAYIRQGLKEPENTVPPDSYFENPVAFEQAALDAPSDYSIADDELQAEKETSYIGTALDTFAFVTSPLMALGDAVIAPIGAPANTGSFLGDVSANAQVSWNAFTKALSPTYGEERPEYGKAAARELGIDEKWGMALEIVTDPTMLLGIGAAKIFQKGLSVTAKTARGATQLTKAGKPLEVATKTGAGMNDVGPWRRGIEEALGVSRPAALTEAGGKVAGKTVSDSQADDLGKELATVEDVPVVKIEDGEGTAFLGENFGYKEDMGPAGWVEEKQAAQLKKADPQLLEGATHTATFSSEGGKPLVLPRAMLDNLPGRRGEEAFRDTGVVPSSQTPLLDSITGDSYANKLTDIDPETGLSLKDSVAKKGIENPIFIQVNQEGKAYISEGNHRLAAAEQAGLEEVPVEIRYYNGGQEAAGNFHPDKVARELQTTGKTSNIDMATVDIDNLTPNMVSEIVKRADLGDRQATEIVAKLIDRSPRMNKGAAALDQLDEDAMYETAKMQYGDFDGDEVVLTGDVIPEELLQKSASANINTLGGRINLAKSHSAEDGSNNIIRRMEEIFSDQFDKLTATEFNSGTVRAAQNIKLADILNSPVRTLSPKEAYVLRQSLIASADHLHEAARRVASTVASPADELIFDKALIFHKVIQAKAKGAASHAGRLLQSYNIKAGSNKERLREINRMLEDTILC